MIVNELAKEAGIASHVVRYYARIGLLKPKRDRCNGYKLFSSDDVHRLQFIRQAQRFGFTLSDIATILGQYEEEGCESCHAMYVILRRRAAEHRRKLEEMINQQRCMDNALTHWDTTGNTGCAGSPLCPAVQSRGCAERS